MRHNPFDFGTVGAGDDTAAINGALAAIRTDFGGVLELDCKLTAGGYGTFYDVGPLDATLCSRMKIEFDPRVVLRGSQMIATSPAAIIDLTGSHEVDCEYGAVYAGAVGSDPWSPIAPIVRPLAAVLIANNSDKIRFVSSKQTGWFVSGCFCVFDADSIVLENCQLIQRSDINPNFGAASPALMLSSNPGEWGCNSIFQTLTPGINAVTNFQFISSQAQQISTPSGPDTGWAIYMRNVAGANFVGGIVYSQKSAYFLFQGSNNEINLFGVNYSSGPPPSYVFENQGAASNVRNYAPIPSNMAGACSVSVIGGTPITGYVQV